VMASFVTAGNTAKQKSLHALGLVPAAAMLDRTPLTAQPPDATPSPYDAAAERRKRSASQTHDQQLGERLLHDVTRQSLMVTADTEHSGGEG
jgi:hypothetical protein